jgi:hypothetical protein
MVPAGAALSHLAVHAADAFVRRLCGGHQRESSDSVAAMARPT